MENFEPVLYILMRKDIPDLNPGKAMAQACHAQSSFLTDHFRMQKNPCYDMGEDYKEACESWLNQVNNEITVYDSSDPIRERNAFGTTIVLEVTEAEVKEMAVKLTPRYHAISVYSVTDPTYPFRNHYGEMFTMPLVTCYYVFAYKPEHFEALKHLPLHR